MPEDICRLILATGVSSVVQFITVIIIFAIVLALTYFSTRLVGGIQKNRYVGSNIEVVESIGVGNNKIAQIIRVGDRYYAIISCKDTVTLLGEIDKENLNEETLLKSGNNGFDAMFNRFANDAKKRKDNQEDR